MGNLQLTHISAESFTNEALSLTMKSVLTTLDNLIGIKISTETGSALVLTDNDKAAITTHLRGVFEMKTNAQKDLLKFLEDKQIITETASAEKTDFTQALVKASPTVLLTELFETNLQDRISSENFASLCGTIETQCKGSADGTNTLLTLLQDLATRSEPIDPIKFFQENIPNLTKESKKELADFMVNIYIPFKTFNPGLELSQNLAGTALNEWAQGIARNAKNFPVKENKTLSAEAEIARRKQIIGFLSKANQELQELQSSGLSIDINKFIDGKLTKLKGESIAYKEDLAEIHQHLQSVLANGSKVEERQSGMKGFLDNIGGKNALLFLFLPIIAGPAAMILSKVPLIGATLAKVLHGFVEHGSSAMVAVVASGLTKGGGKAEAPAKATQGA